MKQSWTYLGLGVMFFALANFGLRYTNLKFFTTNTYMLYFLAGICVALIAVGYFMKKQKWLTKTFLKELVWEN